MRKVSARRLQLIIQVLTGARPERTIVKPKEERLIKEKIEIRPRTMNYPMGMK
jgi:hypothetical protein